MAFIAILFFFHVLNSQQVFKNIGGCDNDIGWRRDRGPQYSIIQALRERSLDENENVGIFDAAVVLTTQSGVAVLDYDNDGDDDILVANGPSRPNSLYTNLYEQTGYAKFVNLASEVGISGLDSNGNKINGQDGSGICYGDIDNDGDSDVVIIGRETRNMLYINNNGVFEYKNDSGIDVFRGLAGGSSIFVDPNPDPLSSSIGSSCTFGDVNNDGYIDLFIVNSGNATFMAEIFFNLDGFSEHNELYLNNGDNTFTDISISSGIRNTVFRTFPSFNGIPTISWATTMVDFNMDGYMDIIHLDDALSDGLLSTRGQIQIFINNGDNPTTFRNAAIGRDGGWMGIEVADLNYDGTLDMFGSNFGGYADRVLGPGTCEEEIRNTRVFFGTGNDSKPIDENSPFYFFETNVSLPNTPPFDCENKDTGRMRNATTFAWGCALLDYDNDGDLDILHQGALDYGAGAVLDNPGTLLSNDGNGNFEFLQDVFELDPTCRLGNTTGEVLEHCTIHSRRYVKGVAIGDFNKDGRYDVASVSESYYTSEDGHYPIYIDELFNNGDLRDDTAFRLELYDIIGFFNGSPKVRWNGKEYQEGDLFIEENILENGNNWAAVRVRGTVGFNWDSNGYYVYRRRLGHGNNNNNDYNSRMNADGIGTIITFKPYNYVNGELTYSDKINIQPVEGGSSMLSQHSLEKIYGMGSYEVADIDVMFNGGGRNYFIDIDASERLDLYEIPCYYNEPQTSYRSFKRCVQRTTSRLYNNGLISWSVRNRMRWGNQWAYQQYNGMTSSTSSSAKRVFTDSDSSHSSTFSSNVTIFIITIIGAIFAIGLAVYFIYKHYQSDKRFKRDQENIQKMNDPMNYCEARSKSRTRSGSNLSRKQTLDDSPTIVTPQSHISMIKTDLKKTNDVGDKKLFTPTAMTSSPMSEVKPEDIL